MAEPVTVADLKVQLRLGAGASAEDGFLADQIVAARRAIENLTNQDIAGEEPTLPAADIPVARQAIMLLAAYWYDNRDATGAMPAAVEAPCAALAPLVRLMRATASMLDRFIRIERRVVNPDPVYGTAEEAWELVEEVWANVQDVPPSRSERLSDGINIASRPARVRMRYRADITSSMRFVLDGRVLNIVSGPAELGRRDGIEFMVTEMTTRGDDA